MKTNSVLFRVIAALVLYFLIKYLVPFGSTILYPINLLVTYLHELGHALGAVFTGGSVESLQVNPDGSGVCWTRGGNRAIILMGGYIGSALFGNILFYVGVKMPKAAKFLLILLAIGMVFSGLVWFNTMFTTGLLIAFALIFFAIANWTDFGADILMFLGLASVIHIIEDFNVGPTSDLEKYAELFKVIPANVWMYIWLIIVIILTVINLRFVLRENKSKKISRPSSGL